MMEQPNGHHPPSQFLKRTTEHAELVTFGN